MVGSVYILLNPTMPGYLKIGMTTGTPEDRARELSQTTGVPVPYAVAYAEQVIDCNAVEYLIHARLAAHRVNHRREFFHVPLRDAIRELSEIAESVGRHTPPSAPLSVGTVLPPSADESTIPAQAKPPVTASSEGITAGEVVHYFPVQVHSASQMAPRLSGEKLQQLTAIREAVVRVCPDCLWRMRGDGKIVFTPPAHRDRTKFRNLMTLHLAERPMRFRIDDAANKQAGGDAERFDESRLDEMERRLAALLAARGGASP